MKSIIISCRCDWDDYYCYHLMLANGAGHVRVSFFDDVVIISELFVSEADRKKGLATYLLDEVDKLLADRKATIYPLHEWQCKWYLKRGYIVK